MAPGTPARARRERRQCRNTPLPRTRSGAAEFREHAATGVDQHVRTDPGHIEAVGGGSHFDDDRNLRYETRPRGTAVSHEEEMLKLAGNQAGYDAVTSIYTHGLSLIKTAIGKA